MSILDELKKEYNQIFPGQPAIKKEPEYIEKPEAFLEGLKKEYTEVFGPEKKATEPFVKFTYPEWERLEAEGKMTPTMERMKAVGFGPPRKIEPEKEPIELRELWEHLPTSKELVTKDIPKAFGNFTRGVAKTLTKYTMGLVTALSFPFRAEGVMEAMTPEARKGIEELKQLQGETYKKMETTPEELPGAMVAETATFLTLYRAFAPTTTPISAGISKFLTSKFPQLTLTKGGATLMRLLTDAPRIATTMGEVGFTLELADQLAKEDYSYNKLAGETLRSAQFGAVLGIAGAPPTMTQRIVSGLGVGATFSSLETLLKDGQITAEDTPKIVQDAVIAAAITWLNTRTATGAYQNELNNARAKYQAEAKYGKEISDNLARLDAYITTRGGAPKNQRVISLLEEKPISDVQMAYSARNKIQATMKKIYGDYVIAETNKEGVVKVLNVAPKEISLSKFLTPYEKAFLQHLANTTGVPTGFYQKYLEPDPKVREMNIKAPSAVSKMDLEFKIAFPKYKLTLPKPSVTIPEIVVPPPAPPTAPPVPEVAVKPEVKPAPKIAPEAQKAIKEAIPPPKGIIPQELQPLAQEARKYKSAEEFIEGYRKNIKRPFVEEVAQKEMPFQRKYQAKTSAARRKAYDIAEMEWEIKTKEMFGKKVGLYDEREVLTDFYTQAVRGVKEVKPEVKPTIPKELQTKFRHSIWYQDVKEGAYLTKQQALERLAKNPDITLYETIEAIPGRPLLEEGRKVFYLTDGKYKYKLSPVEKSYWDKLKKAVGIKPEVPVKPEAPIEMKKRYGIKYLSKLTGRYEIKEFDSLGEAKKALAHREALGTTGKIVEIPKEVKPEVKPKEKPVVKTKINLIDEGKRAEEQAEILLQLETAQKGERIHWTEHDGTPRTIGVDSSFPKWIPDKLRSRKLFDAVLEHIKNDTLPKKTDEIKLYNIVAEQLGLKEATNIISQEEEIDVSKLFEDEKINDQIPKISPAKEGEVAETIARGVEKEKIEKPKGVPSATIGKFAKDIEVKLGNMDKIKPVEFPELVELVDDLMGRVPEISKRLRKSLGKFYATEKGRIKIRPDLFTKENSDQLAKVLAHEIGHLVDYLPHQTLKRGNLLGSLLSLRKFLKNTYGEVQVTNKEIREELKRVSKYWRPPVITERMIDAKTGKAEFVSREVLLEETPISYQQYRNSSRELYADAISVLFNSPGTLEKMAPEFYESFFKYLDEKPEVKNAYFDLQEVLSHDRATLVQLRRQRIKEMFDRADYKAKELQEINEKRRKLRLKDFWEMFKYGVKSINQPVYNKVRALQKRGVYVPDEQNPEYLLSGRNYLSGKIKGEFKENVQPIMKDLFKNNIDWKTFGEFLYYERIIAGDRSEFANPRGITQKAAEEMRESIKQSLGERYKILEENADKFRGFLKKLATEAYKEGMFREETFDIIKGNEKYVPFQVLEYMENYVTWKTKPQVGTLKDIANPANSLLLKAVSTIRAIENQKDRIATFKMLEEGYPDEIKEADLQFTGKAQRPIPSRDPNFEMVTYYKEGKLRGKYVDPYIAKSLEKDTIAANRAVMTILSPVRYLNRNLFRPLFVVYNPGWIPFNFIRDFMRFWKNTPGMTMFRALKLYGKALRPARVRAFPKERVKPKEIEAEALITKLEKEEVLLITWNDFLMGQTTEDVQIETIFKDMGLMESEKKIPAISEWFNKILKYTGIGPILEWIRKTGSMVETLPKVAGYYELEGKMPPQEMRTFIRRNIGSPDFFEKGYLTAATNDVFLFSNAFIQAVTADANIAIDPKTRGGFWWKTIKTIFLAKILMFLGMIGAFGVGIKKMYEDASEYDMTNYIIIPIGKDSKNGKTAYLRVPTDETSRLLGGVLWKGMYGLKNDQNFMRDIGDVASLFGGQLPSLSPAIEVPLTTAQFLEGKNPYDSFRGRTVLTKQQLEAGGWYATEPFLLWQFQQMGGNVFMKLYAGERTPTEKSLGEEFLRTPVLSNVVGRFLKISDYGSIERYREKLSVVKQEQARKSIDEEKIINDYVKKYQKEEGTKQELYKKMVIEILGHIPKGSEEINKAERLKKKFEISILRGKADPIINSFISAWTNEEKLTLLKVFKEDMTDEEFLELKKTLLKYKIVSLNVFLGLKESE